jgi:hypothetical protein
MIQLQKGEYMNVERVNEWVNRNKPGNRVVATIYGGNFFNTSDLKQIFPVQLFREMECEVITYMIDVR